MQLQFAVTEGEMLMFAQVWFGCHILSLWCCQAQNSTDSYSVGIL